VLQYTLLTTKPLHKTKSRNTPLLRSSFDRPVDTLHWGLLYLRQQISVPRRNPLAFAWPVGSLFYSHPGKKQSFRISGSIYSTRLVVRMKRKLQGSPLGGDLKDSASCDWWRVRSNSLAEIEKSFSLRTKGTGRGTAETTAQRCRSPLPASSSFRRSRFSPTQVSGPPGVRAWPRVTCPFFQGRLSLSPTAEPVFSTGVGRRSDSPVLCDVATAVSPNGLTPWICRGAGGERGWQTDRPDVHPMIWRAWSMLDVVGDGGRWLWVRIWVQGSVSRVTTIRIGWSICCQIGYRRPMWRKRTDYPCPRRGRVTVAVDFDRFSVYPQRCVSLWQAAGWWLQESKSAEDSCGEHRTDIL
jgi:hypothetical protein